MRRPSRLRRIAAPGFALAMAVSLIQPLAASASHGDSPSPELELLGQYEVPLANHTTDVWALGNYAYIGAFTEPLCSFDITGVRVIDISDPTNPTLASFIPAKQGTRNNDVKVAHLETSHWTGDIAVITNEGCGDVLPRLNANGSAIKPRNGQGGIAIWDVTDPTKPHALKQNFLPKNNGIHNTYIWQDDGNAYLIAVDDVAVRDTIIVDITNPASPKEIARVGPPDWPDLDFSDVEGPAVFLHDVWVQDDIAYLSYWDAGLVLLDVSDPANPVFLGDSTYPNPDRSGLPPEGNGHVAVPTADGSLVIFGDEDTSKASLFALTTISGEPQSTNKVAGANFGPDTSTFPTPGVITFVADDFGCNPSDFNGGPGTGIALIQRGVCFFQDKADNAELAGYDAYIVYNDAARGDGLVQMGARDSNPVAIAGLFFGHTRGQAMANAVNGGMTVTVDDLAAIDDGEGFMRVLDVTDPGNIVQVGSFVTENVLPPNNALKMGTRDAHNVVVHGDLAYWAWYYEGIRVVDFGACSAGQGFEACTPGITEVAHWGGGDDPPDSFWGVYVHELPSGQGVILGSGRNHGLYIFDLPGATTTP